MIMKKVLLVLLVLLSLSAWSQISQPLPNTYVNDYAGKLSPQKHANEVGNGFLTGFIVLLIALGICFILYYFYYLPKQKRLEREQEERDRIRRESMRYKAFNKPKEPEQQKITVRTLSRTNYPSGNN